MQSSSAECFASEYDLYRGMNSSYTCIHIRMREAVETLVESGFDFLHEIQQQVRCHKLPGVLKVEAVLVAAEPCKRVRGLMTQFCPRGTLRDVLR
jgi:hypothetical protein